MLSAQSGRGRIGYELVVSSDDVFAELRFRDHLLLSSLGFGELGVPLT